MIVLIILAVKFGFTSYLFYGFLTFNIIRFTIKKNWKGFRKYMVYLVALFTFRWLGIDFIWFILAMILYPLVINKNFPSIAKHPILSYELCIRQVQLLWLNLVSKNLPTTEDDWFNRSKKYCIKRIEELNERGVKFDFIETKV